MYSKDETADIIWRYLAAEDKSEIITTLAKEYNKSDRSIIGKLSKEKVYIKKSYQTKVGTKPVTKKEMIFDFSEKLNADPERMQGLDKCSKPDLEYLIKVVLNKIAH